MLIFILILINIPIYKAIFKSIFDSIDDLNESIRYSFTPDFFSLFRGKYFKDKMAEFKLSCFIVSYILVVTVEYFFLSRIMEWFI